MWFALIWPTLVVIILITVKQLRPHIVWWELLLPWIPSIILIPLSIYLAETYLVSDTERWAGYSYEAQYYEPWDEYIHRTCTRQVPSGVDSKGNVTYTTQFYDCSYVEHHREYWELKSTLGDYRISKDDYNQFVSRWGNKKFVDMHRHYHSYDGDMYKTVWDKQEKTREPVFKMMPYANRTQAASLYQWQEINTDDSPVYDYYGVSSWKTKSIYGPHSTNKLQHKLDLLNSHIGPHNQCQVFICTWKNQSQSIGFDQQHYWKGGNKNELVITIGTDDHNIVQWCYVFSWMDNQTFSYNVRDYVLRQGKLDLNSLIDMLKDEVPRHWHRKKFAEFDMLQVTPPAYMVWLTHIFSLLFSAGVGIFVVVNEIKQ